MAREIDKTSYLFGSNAFFIEELYENYLSDPSSVDSSWAEFFKSLGDNKEAVLKEIRKTSWAPRNRTVVGVVDKEELAAKLQKQKEAPKATNENTDSARAHMLIRAYRVRGHLLAKLDPLDIEKLPTEEELRLDPGYYGFGPEDLDRPIHIGKEVFGIEKVTLRELIAILKRTYSSNIGVEFMHIQSLEQKEWIQSKIEAISYEAPFSKEEKKEILQNIIDFETFEQFLHVKFPGAKRFSVEGGENGLTSVNTVIKTAALLGVKEIIVGMPHRGRLNMLTKVMGKPYASMLSEFQGNLAFPEDLNISGDVKYHLGTSSDRDFGNGKKVHLSLTPNPSHLEAVNPVVVGKVRAKQDIFNDENREQVMGLLLHGDAAFAGQGVVAETLSLSELAGYKTGGTVHVIVNNQIGFTTSPKFARVSRYPTEVAKMVEAPIFHVHGDDPEAVIRVSKIAAEYRQKFKTDVVIDVICYRLHGHNETDEPMFTQPTMYKRIAEKQTPATIYATQLQQEGTVTSQEAEEMKNNTKKFLDGELEASKTYKPNKADWLEGEWKGFVKPDPDKYTPEQTGVDLEQLKKIGNKLAEYPSDFKVNSKIARALEAKKKMMETGEGLDWSMGEALAFATLLAENIPVRLSGQDCRRGTFSHRHAVLVDQENDKNFVPLNNLGVSQAKFEVINSNLSEFGVLGFEYGYSIAKPRGLTIWEAQFGDFANGAQVIIDQFISSAEIKWLRMSGLVMLLPHGYEGQGPEHSSARLERYLQLCAEDNMQVVNCTTPANFFHALRRQICRNFRKPLIVMTPKSLLRHKLAISSLKEMEAGTTFKMVIPEVSKLVEDDKVKKLVITSGKLYYDIFEEREKRGINDIAIIRLEQYYPFPVKEIMAEVKKYKNAEVVWAQEEPKNMGAWDFVDPRIEEVLIEANVASKRPKYIGRRNAASPAAGYVKIHTKEQADIIEAALKI
jgi:2-oxoglutarate dehydrogenase E1 component